VDRVGFPVDHVWPIERNRGNREAIEIVLGSDDSWPDRRANLLNETREVDFDRRRDQPEGSHVQTLACPICRNGRTRFWFEHVSRTDGRAYQLYKCNDCKSAHLHPYPTADYLIEFYVGGNRLSGATAGNLDDLLRDVLAEEVRFPNSVVDAERICTRLSALAPGKRFLDIGAGDGFFSRAARAKGFDVTAIELNPASRAVFQRMNGFEAVSGGFGKTFAENHKGVFDAALLSQVLEHLPLDGDPITDIHDILTPGGLCSIAVPHFGSTVSYLQGKRDMFISPPAHVNFFTISGLNALFTGNGFQPIAIETVSRFDRRKFAGRFNLSLIGVAATGLLQSILDLSDRLDRGMFINAYYRKV
jgi:SAM-dependent methyltransferase